MDEEQLQELQRRHYISAASYNEMTGGTAGFAAPGYNNNDLYLTPEPNSQPTTNQPSIAAAAAAPSRASTMVPTEDNSGQFDISEAASSLFDTGTNVLGDNIVGEGINTAENANLGGVSDAARNVNRFMPVVGLYTDSTGLYDNVTGTGSAEGLSDEEQAVNIATNGAGLISSTFGTGAFLGELLTAYGASGGVGSGLASSTGTGLTAALGEGTVLAGVGTVAASGAALLAAGAAGYGLGTYVDEETGLADDMSNSAIIGVNGGNGPNVQRGFRSDEAIATNPVERTLADNIANSLYTGINGGLGPIPQRGFRPDEAVENSPVRRTLADNISNSVNIAVNGGTGPNARRSRTGDANIAPD